MFSEGYTSRLKIKKKFIRRIGLTFHAYRTIFSTLFFLSVSGALLFITGKDTPLTLSVRAFFCDFSAPILKGAKKLTATFMYLSNRFENLITTESQIIKLQTENNLMKSQLNALSTLEKENKHLQSLLAVKKFSARHFVSAQVLSYPGEPFLKSMIISAGKKDSIQNDQPVVNEDGLVGRTLEVGENAARVLLITDINFTVPVLILPSKTHALLSGTNANKLKIKYQKDSTEFHIGDTVETSGVGGIFNAGIPVGTISEISDESIFVSPSADLNNLRFVSLFPFTPYFHQVSNF